MLIKNTLALTLASFLATSPLSAVAAPVSTEISSANTDTALSARDAQAAQHSSDIQLERREAQEDSIPIELELDVDVGILARDAHGGQLSPDQQVKERQVWADADASFDFGSGAGAGAGGGDGAGVGYTGFVD